MAITPKGKDRFFVEVYVRGVVVARKTLPTKAAARRWHDSIKDSYLNPFLRRNPNAEMEFAQVVAKYREVRVPQLRESTQQTQGNRFQYLTESPLWRMKVSEIDARTIDGFFEWLRKQPTATSAKRKNFRQEFNLLRSVLNWYRNYLNESYVVPIVKRHCEAVNYKPVPPRRPDYFMRVEQIQDWLVWLKERTSNPVYHRLAMFMVLTGCRVGEACGLYWDVVDLRNSLVSVVRTAWWDHQSKQPRIQDFAKTGSSVRIIRLSDPLIDLLNAIGRESPKVGPVFCSAKGEVLRYPAVQSAFNKGFKALGLPWTSTHICRHSFATLALQASRDLSAVQAAMGHDDIGQTQVYAKNVALLDGKVNNQLANLIDLKAVIGK